MMRVGEKDWIKEFGKKSDKEKKKEFVIKKQKRIKELMGEGLTKKIATLLWELENGLRNHDHPYKYPPKY